MKKCKKTLALILSMLMLMSVFSTGASAYFPYINNGGDAISKDFQITSVNVTDLYGDEVTELAAGEGALVSCKVKAVDGSGQVQLIATAYNSAGKMVAVKRSQVVTLGKNAEDVGVYLTVEEAATSFKAFIWDGTANLIPLTKSADSASENVNVLDVSFNGESVDKDVTTHDVTIPVYQLDMPSVQILTDNPAARVEVTSTHTFPLTKQHGDVAVTASVTATVTLNGVVVKTYTFNVTQQAPQIIDATLYQWSDNTLTNAVTEEITESTTEYIVLKQIKEADYSNLGYTQSQLSSKTPATTPVKADGQYFVTKDLTNTWYGLIDIAPEFLNGVLIQQKVRGVDSLRTYSMYSMNKKGVKNTEQAVIQISDTICVDDVLYGTSGEITPYAYSFKLNRSAMVYVLNKPDGTSTADKKTIANEKGFENAGFTMNNDLVLKYANLNGVNEPTEYVGWYEKHVEVAGNDEVMVKVPIGVNPMLVIIKFDEAPAESIVSNASYTLTDKTVTPVNTEKLFAALPIDDNIVVNNDNKDEIGYSSFLYAVTPWSEKDNIINEIDDEVVGAEIITGLPYSCKDMDSISFTLNESADVYFAIRCKQSTTVDHWLAAKTTDWFEDGWRLIEQSNVPVQSAALSATTTTLFYRDFSSSTTVMKHFDVADEAVTVTIDGLQDLQKYNAGTESNPDYKFADRQILVIIKKTDR